MAEEKKTETEQKTDEEKLFAGKFKNVEDLEKSYKEAEKEFHTSRTRVSELEKEVAELKRKSEEIKETEKEDEETTDMAEYEYLTKADLLKVLKKQNEDAEKKYEDLMKTVQNYIQGNNEIQKIRASHPELSDSEIQNIINSYPEEATFEDAYKKRREEVAKIYGLNVETKTGVTTKEVKIPADLHGTEETGATEDRSRIERMKIAGTSGKMPLTKK
jgi:DNA repair exonuclease SbcCD ATPase subunit